MFPKTSPRKNEVDVFYNLYEYADELYLPEAYVATRDKEGLLAHIKQKATPATIGAFHLELTLLRKKLFQVVADLHPTALAKQFYKGRKKNITLDDLLEERDIKKAIQKFVHRRLDVLLSAVAEFNLPLSWQVERRVLVKDFVVHNAEENLQPHLHFKKLPDVVEYQLKLTYKGQAWPMQSKDIQPITNQPGWIWADDFLYKVNHVNGFLLKPFRNKTVVRIPKKSVKAYFQTFILKIANRVEIKAEGFEVLQFDQLESCRIEAQRHLFEKRWILSVQMDYNYARFGWNEQRQQKTSLEIDGEEVRIMQVKRDAAAESDYLKKLQQFDIQKAEDSGYFILKNQEDKRPYALLEWLGAHREQLLAASFSVPNPEIDGKAIDLTTPKISMEVSNDNDWFDIKGQITVGAFTFPFTKLANYIRNENHFYPLPDGSVFLIPEEWMARYKQIADFAQNEQQHLKLAKSQYMLLQESGIIEPATVAEENLPEYSPSPLLLATLRPYQLEGVRWLSRLHHQGLGACLADDMGLGKTLQTIALLLMAKTLKAERIAAEKENDKAAKDEGQLDLFKINDDQDFLQPLNALVVMPSSLIFNWENEIKKFAPSLSINKHIGPKRHKDARILSRFDVTLTTYQTALRDQEILEKINFEYIVLDESQQIKNRNSKVFKALNQLQSEHKISLSGTPIENSLSDLWSQMQFINEGLLGSFNFFRKAFMHPIERQNDEDKKVRLRQLVEPYLLRRTKEEVAKDLPDLHVKVFYSEMEVAQKKLYEKEKSAARNYLLENFDASNAQYRMLVVQTLTKLRQLANHPVLTQSGFSKESGKFNDIMEQWQTIQRSGHKVLLFSSFVKYLELFKTQFETQKVPFSWLSGSLNSTQRKQQVEQFQEDPAVQSFLISIKTGGTGLNLTAADYVFILDPWWNPSTEQQAIARAHRIGQTNHVFATKFITKGSIEEKILKLQQKKSQLAEDIIGKSGKLSFDKNELAFLLD